MELFNQLSVGLAIFGIILAAIIIYKPYFGLLTICFMIPLENLVRLYPSFTAIKAIGIISFLSFCLHCLMKKEKIKIKKEILIFLSLFMIWATIRAEGNYFRVFMLAQLFFFFIMTISLCEKNNKRIDLLIWAYIFSCLIAVYISASGYISSQIFSARASIEGQDQNNFALIVGLGILLLWFVKSIFMGWKILIPFLMGIFLVYGLIISASRGAIIALSMTFFFYLMVSRNKLKSLAIGLIIFLVVGSVVIVGLRSGLIREFSIERVGSARTYEQTTLQSRIMIWHKGWRIIKDHFIIGVGLGNFPKYYKKYTNRFSGRTLDPHNTYLSILAETGFIGFVIAICFIVFLFYFPRKSESENKIMYFCILAFICIDAIVGTIHYKKVFWFGIAIAYLLLTYSYRNTGSQKLTNVSAS